MKKKSASQSAFLNLRVLASLFLVLTGVFLALLGFGAFSAQAQEEKEIAENSISALVPPGFDCAQLRPMGIDKQENFRAGAIMIFCHEAEGGSASAFDEPSAMIQKALGGGPLFGTTDVDLVTGTETSPHIIQSETYTAANPDNPLQVLVAYNDSRGAASSNFSGLSVSTDGGTTFTRVTTAGGQSPFTNTFGDPVVLYNKPTATWYTVWLDAGCGAQGLGGYKSTNPSDATSWTHFCVHSGGSDDRESGWADNNPSSPFFGRMYVSWNDFTVASGALFVRYSTDNGATWTNSRQITTSFIRDVQITGDLATGDVYIAGMNEGGGGFPHTDSNLIFRSTDGGNTWTNTYTGPGFAGPGVTAVGYFAQMFSDGGGFWRHEGWGEPAAFNHVVHLVYSQHGAGSDPGNVFYIRSTDSGVTFGAPFQLNTDSTTRPQWQVNLSVSPTGTVFATWYDARDSASCTKGNPAVPCYKMYSRKSNDNGATWLLDEALSDVVSPLPGQSDPNIQATYAGDYDYGSALLTKHLTSWTDGRVTISSASQQDTFTDRELVGFGVTTTTPACGSIISTQPTDFIVNITDPATPATVQASDFTVNSIAANSVIYTPGTTMITFHYNSTPVTTQGLQTMQIPAGAFTRASDSSPNFAFTCTFRYDALPLQVTTTVPAVNGTFSPSAPNNYQYDVNFNEAVAPASVQTSDLTVSGNSNPSVTGVSLVNGNTTARFTLHMNFGGTMTANIAAGAITDPFGNPGAAFTGSYTVEGCPPQDHYNIAQIGGSIVPGTTDIGNHTDDGLTTVLLPFPYTLYDTTYSSVNLSSNGNAQFVTNDNLWTNTCLPWTTHDYTIFPYWDDQCTGPCTGVTGTTYGIFTSISGTAPNRIFNIEWRTAYYNSGGTGVPLNYELRLYEGQTRFDVIYGPAPNGNTSATAGVQKNDTASDQYFCNGTGGASTGGQSYIIQSCGTPSPTPTATATSTGTPSPTPTATSTVPSSPTPTPSPTPCTNYAFTVGSGAIVPGTTDTGNHTDDNSTVIPLPFPYTVYDQTFNNVAVGSNGHLTFGTVNNAFNPTCIPIVTATYAIFPYETDQCTLNVAGCVNNTGTTYGIFTSISGTAPNRIFNVEWRTAYYNSADTTLNYEVRLYEGQTAFDMIYATINTFTPPAARSLSVGVQKTNTTQFTLVGCDPTTGGSNPPVSSGQLYHFTLAGCGTPTPSPSGTPTATATATATATGTPPPSPTQTPCAGTVLNESFDGVTAPALPAGWVAANAAGTGPLWVTTTTTPDTAPNDAFIDDPASVSDKRLDTPPIAISSAAAQVSFRNFYFLESTFDGGVLEVSSPNINAGAFTDVTNAAVGGSFATGGYNATISTAFMSPIAGRTAWSGNAGGYINSVANLGPNVAGHTIKLRFRMASDNSVSATGWRVDTVRVVDGACPSPTSTPGTPSPTPSCVPVITQSTSQAITASNSVSCNNGTGHTDNSYWRAFNMGTFVGGAAYNVSSVSFGVESANNTQPVTVRLYTNAGAPFPGGTRTQIATTTINVTAAQTGTVVTTPIVVTVPAGTSELVMELFTPDGTTAGNLFFVGSNAAPETGPSYLSATACGITTPTTTAAIGFPNMHIVFNVNGSCGGGPSPTASATASGTPSATPSCTPLSEGFTDITTLLGAGWVETNHSGTVGTTNWFQGNSTVFPAQGGAADSYIGANFNNTIGTDTISNWLLTPPVTLLNGETMIFWTRTVDAPAFPDRLQVRMSTNGSSSNVGTTATDVGDFTTLLLDINPTYTTTGYPNVWTQFTVTVTGVPTATQGRLALRYFVENGGPTGANSDYIGIDTFLFNGPCGTVSPTPSATPTATFTSTPTVTPSSPTPTATATTPVGTPSPTATPSVTPAAHPQNLSTRMRVLTDANVGIGGFIIAGTAPKQVLLRGIGPSLANFGVPDPLVDPVMELHGPTGFTTIINDNWGDTQRAAIKATGLAPTNELESAILVMLDPGAYTGIVRGNNNGTGVGLVEVYDLDPPAGSPQGGLASQLANISTRAFVGTGTDIMIAGFILGGNPAADSIIVRGIGPSLTQFGVPGALADPTLELRDDNGALLRANNDWQEDPAQAALISAAGLAPSDPLESAIAATLPPGQYTALLAGLNSGTGVGLVEAYSLGGGAAPVITPTPTPGLPSPTPAATATATATATAGGPSPSPGASPSTTPVASPSPVGPCVENFDAVTAPALPAGWVASNPDPGDGVMWVTSTTSPDSAPNDAFIPDQDGISDKVLDRLGVSITGAGAMMTFRNNFNTEFSSGIYWDGYVLEVSSPNISGGDFLDITDSHVGGSFVSGGYTGQIDGTANNPLAGRMAWSADSGGYIDTVINMGPNLVGAVTLRFRMGSDEAVAAPGVRIDNISITNAACP